MAGLFPKGSKNQKNPQMDPRDAPVSPKAFKTMGRRPQRLEKQAKQLFKMPLIIPTTTGNTMGNAIGNSIGYTLGNAIGNTILQYIYKITQFQTHWF